MKFCFLTQYIDLCCIFSSKASRLCNHNVFCWKQIIEKKSDVSRNHVPFIDLHKAYTIFPWKDYGYVLKTLNIKHTWLKVYKTYTIKITYKDTADLVRTCKSHETDWNWTDNRTCKSHGRGHSKQAEIELIINN